MKLDEIYTKAPTVLDQAQREQYYEQGYIVFTYIKIYDAVLDYILFVFV